MNKNLSCTKISILALLIVCIFSMFGCSKENIKYTNLQKSYFDISTQAKNKNSFTKDNLENIIGSKVSTYLAGPSEEDLNVYLFEVNDEKMRVYTDKKSNELYLLKYEGDVDMINSLKEGIDLGYAQGLTIQYKTDSIDQQKAELSRHLNKN
jgi:hypothetical protein